MLISSIVKENQGIFEHLLPDDLTAELEQGTCFGLGAIGGEEEERYVCGVLVFEIASGSNGEEDLTVADLRWLYVAQEHRNEGAADALMTEFFEIVQKSQIPHVMCDLPFSDEYDLLCAYLELWEFEFHTQNLYELRITVKELAEATLLQAKPGKAVAPLDAVSSVAFRQFMLQAKELPMVLTDLPLEKGQYEERLSCLYIENGAPMGGVLVAISPAGELEILLMRALTNRPETVYQPLVYCAQAARRHYPLDTPVKLCCRTGAIGNVIARLFPQEQPAVVRRGYLEFDADMQAGR